MLPEVKVKPLAHRVVRSPKQFSGRSTQLPQELLVNQGESPSGVHFQLPNLLLTRSLQILSSAFR